MSVSIRLPGINWLGVEGCSALAEELCGSISEESATVLLPDPQPAETERRLADHETNPDDVVAREDFRSGMTNRLKTWPSRSSLGVQPAPNSTRQHDGTWNVGLHWANGSYLRSKAPTGLQQSSRGAFLSARMESGVCARGVTNSLPTTHEAKVGHYDARLTRG